MVSIEVVDYFGGTLKNLGTLDAGLRDGNFTMRTASMKSETDFIGIIIPIKGVLHFITVVVVVVIGENFGRNDRNLMLAE